LILDLNYLTCGLKSKTMKKILLLLLIPFATSAQIMVMDVVQVKEGKSNNYEAIEAFVSPIQEQAIKDGKKMGWYVFKNIGGGDLSEIENKGIGDYIVLNVYKDLDQMKSDSWDKYMAIAKKVYKGKMSSRNINKKMSNIGEPRKDTRSYTMENLYYTKPNPPVIGNIYSVSPIEQLSDDYEKFEMEFFRPMFEKNILAGNHKAWNFNKVIDNTENAYQNITHLIFNQPVPGAKMEVPSDFLNTQLQNAGIATRKIYNSASIQLLFMQNNW